VEKSQGGVTGRPHIARVLIEKGYVSSIEEAFDKYLGAGRPAYFKKDKLTPQQCIEEIRAAGGLPVLAHPIYLGMGFAELDILLEELKKSGLMGIEAYYVDNTHEQTEELLELACKHDLLVTGGSDFHGEFKPDIQLGIGRGELKIPYALLEKMKKAYNVAF
jgi:predicted metal-dependent phosphoesterase TrpH